MDRILLGQLGANGDCLYATILARQLRHDYPNAHITWAISSQCVDVIRNNPHIDDAWVIPIRAWHDHALLWQLFDREALRRYRARQFDHVLLSQIWPSNFQNYDGTVRPSILRSYGRPITVPIENVINLTDGEIERVEDFAREHRMGEVQHRILFECSSKSGQSFVTPEMAQEVAEHLYALLPDSMVIFNTHLPMEMRNPRSRHAGSLSLRESAWLTRHCSLFVGSGSGGTVAANSTASANLPMIQLLAASTSVFASFAHDFEYFGINDRKVVEMTDERPERIAQAIAAACLRGIDAAQVDFGQAIPVKFDLYFSQLDGLLKAFRYLDAARSLQTTAERYGWSQSLLTFAETTVLPNLRLDPSWMFGDSRRFAEGFRAEVAAASRHPVAIPRQTQGGYGVLGSSGWERQDAVVASISSQNQAADGLVAFESLARLREAVSICEDEIAVVNNELATFEVPTPKSLAGTGVVPAEDVRLTQRSRLPLVSVDQVGGRGRLQIQCSPDRIWQGLADQLRGDPDLGTKRVLVSGRVDLLSTAHAALSAAGFSVDGMQRGYGLNAKAIAPGLLTRPAPHSLFGWLTSPTADPDAIGAVVLIGEASADHEIEACRDAKIAGPIYLVLPERGGLHRLAPLADPARAAPRISLVTPSYNQAAFIERTIRSVLDQGYPDLEYVIVDGGSTDGSIEIIRRYESHLHAFVHEKDRGQSDAINKGFALTTGEVLNWLCSDDLLKPGSLDRIAMAYRRHRPDLIAGGCARIGEQDTDLLFDHHSAIELGRNVAFDPLDILRFTRSWQAGNYFFQPEVFFSRRIWELSGGYIKEHLFYAMDIDLWLRMALAGASVRHIPVPLAASRVHEGQKTRSNQEWVHQLPILLAEHKDTFERMLRLRQNFQ